MHSRLGLAALQLGAGHSFRLRATGRLYHLSVRKL